MNWEIDFMDWDNLVRVKWKEWFDNEKKWFEREWDDLNIKVN